MQAEGLQHLHYFSSLNTTLLFPHSNMTANHFAYQTQQAWIWNSSMESFHGHQHLGEEMGINKEPMFEKLLTPSDVGKLNRLVIPKQHAEKYFPLDGDAGEKGLLLSFEDDGGKLWRFRYSYWTSSQSYVLTKGWSRFVKEKRLDAGDVILFLRRRSNGERLYIACRRRGAGLMQGSVAVASVSQNVSAIGITPDGALPWDPALVYSRSAGLPSSSSSYVYLNSVPQGDQQSSSEAGAANTGISKRLRLFGVNLECGHLFTGSHSQEC